jgi:hypothetical protein
MTVEHYASAVLSLLIGLWIGSFARSYLAKKAENLATHEDIDKLVEQVGAVTTVTKQIESALMDQVWNRQRQWELRKETLFEVLKEVASVRTSIIRLISVFGRPTKSATDDEDGRNAAMKEHQEAVARFLKAQFLASVVAQDELIHAFKLCHTKMTFSVGAVVAGKTTQAIKELSEAVTIMDSLPMLVRVELNRPILSLPEPSPTNSWENSGPE